MKLIIVDDSHTKVEIVMQAINASKVDADITHVSDASSARKRMREEEFDLLLIDLQLPDSAGAPPNQNGGLKFFDLLLEDTKTTLPPEILFITCEDGLVTQGRFEVERRGSALCAISELNDSWLAPLTGQLKLAARRADRRIISSDVAIITALGMELDAVLALDFGWNSFRLNGDPSLYHKGTFNTNQGLKTVVAASALRKGMAASAALATKLVLKFNPKMLVMTGICAGVKGKTNLGDVVVGAPTWDWGSGKHAESNEGSVIFKLSPRQIDLNMSISTLCDEIARSAEFKKGVRSSWDKSFPPGEFMCHIGPMASGASVIANKSVSEDIAAQNRDLIAIEMEAFAVMVASEYATSASIFSVAIKSVCDFADNEKQDGWQNYAAYTSAQFTAELFKKHFS